MIYAIYAMTGVVAYAAMYLAFRGARGSIRWGRRQR